MHLSPGSFPPLTQSKDSSNASSYERIMESSGVELFHKLMNCAPPVW
jgi:hypothetical protein